MWMSRTISSRNSRRRRLLPIDPMNSSRRKFITAASYALAGFPAAAAERDAASTQPTDAPRVQAIDCQSHLFCPEVVAMMERRTRDPIVRVKDGQRVVIMGDWVRKFMPRH